MSGASADSVVEAGSAVRGRDGAHYDIVRQLGPARAEVWLARLVTADGFTREVALKCVTPDPDADERVRRRRLGEAQLAGRLSHPNIAEALALERLGNRHYLVLEYVQGASLAEALEAARRQGRSLSEGFCCHVVASVAEALDYVHALTGEDGRSLGIVHRDVKAANIMVAASGAVKLLDFGVAYSRMEGRDRTQTGKIRGTCAYLSPEQAAGAREEEIDGRSDIFSLGVVLVELLTGERPFDAGNDILTIHRIAECSAAQVEGATQRIPGKLRDLCRKALAKDRSQRFNSGGEIAAALRGYLVRRGVPFFTAECALEVRQLGLAGSSKEPASGATVTGAWAPESDKEGEGSAPPSPAVAERRRPRRRLALALALVAAGGIAAGGSLLGRRRARVALDVLPTAPASVTSVVAGIVPGDAGGRCEEPARSAVHLASARSEGELPAELVVRPKKKSRAVVRVVSDREGGKTLGEKVSRGSSEEGGPAGARVLSALARGTLIPARVVDAIDATSSGPVAAVVAEDVASGGNALVPKGSALRCSSRRGRAGRVEVSCDGIRTAKGEFVFSGMAVEGGHVGLRVVDGRVAAGTSFLVYVSVASSW